MFLKKSIAALALSLVCLVNAQDLKFEKYQLPNGMTIILHEDHSLPNVAVNLWYHVGSKDEVVGRSGFAHLFEHLMFMGTKRVPTGQFDNTMETGGGSNNASTSEDRTNYYDNGPARLLPTLLWLEADRLEALGKNMDQKKLDLQREVVKNERRQSYENQPYGNSSLLINSLMFPDGHPYHIPVIGLHEDLNAAAVKDVQDFFATFYVPNNVSLVVAGDFKSAEIKPLIDSLFATLPRQNDPVHRSATPVHFEGIRRQTVVDPAIKQPRISMVWHSPSSYSAGDIHMNLVASLLGDDVTGKLYERLVTQKDLATQVNASQNSLLLGSLFEIDVTTKPGADLAKVETEIDAVLAEFRQSGPSAVDLKRLVARTESSNLNALQSIENRADRLNEFEYYFGDPGAGKRVLDMYRSATPSSVKSFAREVLNPDARLIMRVIPQNAGSDEARNKQPVLGADTAFSVTAPTQFTLSNGVKVYFWHKPELPLMDMNMVFKGGAGQDTSAKAGLSSIAGEMLSQGTGKYDASGFANELNLLGADMGVSTGRLSSSASLNVLSANFDKALELFAGAIERPAFKDADWIRIQTTRIAGLERSESTPRTLGSNTSIGELFGLDTAYGSPRLGHPATIKALSLQDVKDAYTQTFRPEGAAIFVAGSLDQSKVKAALETALGSWHQSGSAAVLPKTIAFIPREQMKFIIVNKPKAVQSVISFTMPGVPYTNENRVALMALNTLFGGSFTSRLNHNLREDKGYTYGAGSRFGFDPLVGTFTASSDVRADVTGPALGEFLKEFAGIRAGNVTDDEATKAKSTMRAETIQSLQGLGGLVGNASNLFANGAEFEQMNKDLATIQSITTADLNRLAKDAFAMEKGVLVIVGDKDLILKQIVGLNLPAPVVVNP